jgi:hypothetical protein
VRFSILVPGKGCRASLFRHFAQPPDALVSLISAGDFTPRSVLRRLPLAATAAPGLFMGGNVANALISGGPFVSAAPRFPKRPALSQSHHE